MNSASCTDPVGGGVGGLGWGSAGGGGHMLVVLADLLTGSLLFLVSAFSSLMWGREHLLSLSRRAAVRLREINKRDHVWKSLEAL